MPVKMSLRIDAKSRMHARRVLAQLKGSLMPIARGLYKEGNIIMNESKMPHNCPVDETILQSSGHVALPEINKAKGSVVVKLGYGGAAKEYAVAVHENLTARHYPPHGKGGRAKYLEIPTMERASVIHKSVVHEMETHLRKMAQGAKR